MVVACLLVVVAMQVWEIRFSPRSSTIATVVELVGENSSASLLGTEVRAADYLAVSDTTGDDRERVASVCGEDFAGLVEQAEPDQPILRKAVLVLHVSGTGVTCLEEGQTMEFGAVEVTARSVGRTVTEGDVVHEISIRESEPWLFIAVTMLTFVLSLFVGAALGVLLDQSYFRSEERFIETDVREANQELAGPGRTD
jgi:hypothetical protein